MKSRALPALLIALCAAAGDEPSDAERLNREATELCAEGKYPEALQRFEAAFTLLPENETLRRNVAEASAAVGGEAAKAEDWERALKRFTRAVQLFPEEPRFLVWLGSAREHADDPRGAEDAYRKALAAAPEDPQPPAFLGRLLVRENRLPEAVGVLEKAVALAPGEAGLAALLEQARKDQGFEKDLVQSGVTDFDVAFDGATQASASQAVLAMLLDAQTEVGNALGLRQKEKIRVILYSAREYSEVTGAPEWAGAHYDGKIRLPVKDLERHETAIRATVRHEYAHALLSQHLPRCPIWIHEALAQCAEFQASPGGQEARLRPLGKAKALLPLGELEGSFESLGGVEAVELAYAESLSFLQYLDNRFGRSAMQVFLSRWKESPDKPYREAFRDAYGSALEDLEKDWRDSLR